MRKEFKKYSLVVCSMAISFCLLAQHPRTFFTPEEARHVSQNYNKYPLSRQSYNDIKAEVDSWLHKDIDVPVPKDPAGGYTHDKHKYNYTLMFNAGVLYQLTGDSSYAVLVRNMLLKYAALNPTLKNHPEATSSSPGRIFWQALNDANWMVYAGMAYDLVHNFITPQQRKHISEGAFKPEVDFVTQELESWFNLIHNHAVWACAGVGIIGIATDNQHYVDMALKGSDKKGHSGFIALMDSLFSPDGYYTEGPYYTRYAILPYMLLANALDNSQPNLKVFAHRNSILQQALNTCLQQTNVGGGFFPLNDALKEKDYTTNELVTAISISWKAFGPNNNWLYVAKQQDRVMLNKGGIAIAAALQSGKVPQYFAYKSIESADGANGKQGGVSILRAGPPEKPTSLLFKYTSHGLSHGHYDKLGIMLYDQGNEILTNYGSVRFIGVEQKYGGRYLPENKSYASQTIAHNTLVVDEQSHFGGKESEAEKYHAYKQYSQLGNPIVQVVSAADTNAYKGIAMQRTLYLLQLENRKPMLLDLFKVNASAQHQYDLPFHYSGQLIKTSFNYQANTTRQQPLGQRNGYEYLWNEASATVRDTIAQLTLLNNSTYYTISTLVQDSATLFLTRLGANDPNFNLRHEPALIVRKKAANALFLNVMEIHGRFDPKNEFSTNAYSDIQTITLLRNDAAYCIATIQLKSGDEIKLAQCNNNIVSAQQHSSNGLTWTGPWCLWLNGKKI